MSGSAQARGQITLHQRIRAELEGRIRSGEWPPGHRLPYEHELMARFGCARMTVNKVMSALAAAGLVERRRRAGTFVARPRVQSAVLQIPDMEAEIARRGKRYGYELLARRVERALPTDPLTFPFPEGEEVLRLTCRHLADDRPIAVEERVIGTSAVPEALQIDFARENPGAWLLRHVPWTDAEHRIFALAADAQTAPLLDLAQGTACLVVERHTWRGDLTVTHVHQTFPGNEYHLVARFTPGETHAS